jgi:hypothetical protein
VLLSAGQHRLGECLAGFGLPVSGVHVAPRRVKHARYLLSSLRGEGAVSLELLACELSLEELLDLVRVHQVRQYSLQNTVRLRAVGRLQDPRATSLDPDAPAGRCERGQKVVDCLSAVARSFVVVKLVRQCRIIN